jgi:AAA domain
MQSKRLLELNMEASRLFGRRDAMSEMYKKEESIVAAAKRRDAWAPHVVAALEHLQHQEHERSVGMFGRLLSALTKDVLPHMQKPVVLNLYTSHGSPALDIDIAASEKNKEEITSGAAKNILSVGLRLIAIARTKQRRFLVLDEPDHWIRPDNVPQFVAVLDKIIRELGFQILMISHHPPSYFSNVAKCVTLERAGDDLKVTGDTVVGEHDGVRAIRLVNFESHTDTLIPIHQGMTVLTGENGLGKSSIVRGLKTLLDGEVHTDRMIRHTPKEANVCRVEIKTSDAEWVGWRRVRKLTMDMRHKNRFYVRGDWAGDGDMPETSYEMAEDTSESVPEFIKQRTNIWPNARWNLHVAAQEESVFLLNRDTKATERAKILSLGGESDVLHRMIDAQRQDSRKDKEAIREGERRLAAQFMVLKRVADDIKQLQDNLPGVGVGCDGVERRVNEMVAMRRMLVEANAKKTACEQWAIHESELRAPPKVPVLNDATGLAEVVQKMAVYHATLASGDVPDSVGEPSVHDVDALKRVIHTLTSTKSRAAVSLVGLKAPGVPSLVEVKVLNETIHRLERGGTEKTITEAAGRAADEACVAITNEHEKALLEAGECPMCGADTACQSHNQKG